MKNLFIFLLLLVSIEIEAQFIPNAGFENWTLVGGWYENPDNWKTTNSQLQAPVMSNSAAYQGSLALIISGPGKAWCRFPLNTTQAQFIGHVKSNVVAGDSTVIRIDVYKSGAKTSGNRWLNTASINSWSLVIIPLPSANSIDSLQITIESGATNSTSIMADDFSIGLTTGLPEINRVNGTVIFPNPFSSEVFIQTHTTLGTANLYNAEGRVIKKVSLADNGEGRVYREDLSAGVYYLEIFVTEHQKEYRKLIICD